MDLLGLIGRRRGLPIVVCCSSRDELDSICSTVSSLPYISMNSLYSDLSEVDRAMILEKFHEASNISVDSGDDGGIGEEKQRSHMIVVTDACLPIIASGESSLCARVLINYELPTKKETYMRRIGTCLAPDGITINMVVGGEVVTLRSIEESSNLVITEMPMHVLEIL